MGAVAACLCVVAMTAFVIPNVFAPTSNSDAGTLDGDSSGYSQTTDIAPMVCIDRVLYQIAGVQPDLTGKEDEFNYLGTISSTVSSSQKPTEDFQANDDIIGAAVYQYDGECVVVEIDGQFWLYNELYRYQK